MERNFDFARKERSGRLSKSKKVEYCKEGIERISSAVIISAASDYRIALKVLKRKQNDISALHTKEDCESFFRYEIGIYSDLDGESIIKKIREMVNEESAKKR